jgi:DNA-binding beta-propeller fold protein YncE
MKKSALFILLGMAALTALSAQTQAALTPEAFLGGHGDYVLTVAFSPDGRRVATGSMDNTVILWNTETGQLIRTLTGHTKYIDIVAFSPDGTRIASASSFDTVKLWNAETGQEIWTIAGDGDIIRHIAFSPDGRRITAAVGRTVKLWNAETGQEIRTITGHNHRIVFAAFSSDGTRIISVSYRAIKVFDPNTGREISSIDSADQISAAACSPDGRSIAAVLTEGGEIRIWNLETGKAIRTIPVAGKGSRFPAVYSPDGRYIATGHSDGKIVIWDVETGRELRTLTGHGAVVVVIAFSPDGRRIFSGSSDNTAKLWDAQTGRELTAYPRIPAPLTREIIGEYLTAVGDRAATTGPFSGASLYKSSPRETALQFGLLVCKAMQETRFLDPQNTAAIVRYEGMLQFISDKNGVSRAETDNYYRQGIGKLVAEAVDEEFNKVGFLLKNTSTSHNAVLSYSEKEKQYLLSYSGAYTKNETRILTATSIEALLAEMRKTRTDFDETGIQAVREQAALIPAVVYAYWRDKLHAGDALALVKRSITNFYITPSQDNYRVLLGISGRYIMRRRLFDDPLAGKAERSLQRTIYSIHPALGSKFVTDLTYGDAREFVKYPANPEYDIFSTPYRGAQR